MIELTEDQLMQLLYFTANKYYDLGKEHQTGGQAIPEWKNRLLKDGCKEIIDNFIKNKT